MLLKAQDSESPQGGPQWDAVRGWVQRWDSALEIALGVSVDEDVNENVTEGSFFKIERNLKIYSAYRLVNQNVQKPLEKEV